MPNTDTAFERSIREAELRTRKRNLPQPKTISEVSLERIEERKLEAIAPSTGSYELDGHIKGFIPGHTITLTGDTNVGKTSIACNFAVQVAEQGKTVLYFALEPENTVVEYIASVRFNKEFADLTEKEISYDDDYIKIYGKEEVPTINDLLFIVEQMPRFDLVVIDHVGYFVTDTKNTNQQQSNVMKLLAGLAKKKKCCILLIAHLRKKTANQKKNYVFTADDISGSAAFKQDANEVLIVTRDLLDKDGDTNEYANTGKIIIAKSKSGPNGAVSITFSRRSAHISLTASSGIMSPPELPPLLEPEEDDQSENPWWKKFD